MAERGLEATTTITLTTAARMGTTATAMVAAGPAVSKADWTSWGTLCEFGTGGGE